MIKAEERFMSEGQAYYGSSEDPKTVTHCNVWDWDQLRMIKVRGTARLFPPDEDVEVTILAQFTDLLSPAVTAITVDDEGLLSAVSTCPEEDDTAFIGYLPFSNLASLHGCRVVHYSRLEEIDRLGPGVDLSAYKDEFGVSQKVAFKFNPIGKPQRLLMAWNELNLLRSLPPHPNILPFDRVVLENVESRVIGFTTKYIDGGTLEQSELPFRLEWLQQLTQVVDFLNLELGIMHQDISPRNLIYDSATQKLLLFDFDWAAHGEQNLLQGRDDVAGVVFTLYEVITGDTSYADVPHWSRDIETVQSMKEWTSTRKLDSDVPTFRGLLDEWVTMRRSGDVMQRYHSASKRLTWPDLPTPPDYAVPFELGTNASGETNWVTGPRLRRTAMEKGQYVFHWERPPQHRLRKS